MALGFPALLKVWILRCKGLKFGANNVKQWPGKLFKYLRLRDLRATISVLLS